MNRSRFCLCAMTALVLGVLTTRAGAAVTIPQQTVKKVEITGVIEVEASHHNPSVGDSTSDVVLATVEGGLAVEVNDWISGEIILLYEEDETDLEVDVATISIATPDGPWSLTGGQFYLPFGVFDTNLVSDPPTLELGESRETALQVDVEFGPVSASVFAFNGTNKKNLGADDKIDNWGVVLGFNKEAGVGKLTGSLGYINDIGDSDLIQDALGSNDVLDHVPGMVLSGKVEFGAFSVIGEYLTATDQFQTNELVFNGRGAEPSATNLELSYSFELAGMPMTWAIAYQTTDESLALELPETRIVTALTIELMDHVTLALELARDKDYGVSDGGTGESATVATAQLALEL